MKTKQQTFTQLAHQFIATKKLKDASTLAYTKSKSAIVESLKTLAKESKQTAILTKELSTFTEPDYGLFAITGTYMAPGLRLNKDLLRQNLARVGFKDQEITALLLNSSKYASPRLELAVEQVRRSYDKEQIIPDEPASTEESASPARKAG